MGGGQRVKVVPSIKHHAFKMYGGTIIIIIISGVGLLVLRPLLAYCTSPR
jgi:hypothetical protein